MSSGTSTSTVTAPFRVILTCNFSPWSRYSGGGQRSTHHLAEALVRRGHDVTVVFTKPPWERVEPPHPPAYRLRWAVLPALRSASAAPLRPLSMVSVKAVVANELARGGGPAIVHGNGEEAALVGALRGRYRFGFIVTSRFPSLPGVLTGESPRSWWRRAALVLLQPKYLLLGKALQAADFCSPPSRFGGDLLRRAYGIAPDRIRPVHNGVPDAFLSYAWKPRKPDDRPLLFFGRFAPSKGVDTLLDALALLGDRAPRTRIVGAGSALAALQEQAAGLDLSDRVEFLGWADHDALGRLLEDASAAVLPSREENFSLAVLSVLAVGTPLATTDVGGTLEVCKDGENALVCKAGDAAGLAAALARFHDDPEAAARMGAAGSALVRRDFTWDATAAKFEELYAQALEAHSAPDPRTPQSI